METPAMELIIVFALLILNPVVALAGTVEEEASAAYEDKDYRKAMELFHSLAIHGSPTAQYRLGDIYYHGIGVEQDYAEAARWMRLSAYRDWPFAQYFLGQMYQDGRGVAKNYAEAAKWYRRAAYKGIPLAEALLGNLYADGEGVPKDYAQAHAWTSLAASGSGASDRAMAETAERLRDAYEAKLLPDQLADAQDRAIAIERIIRDGEAAYKTQLPIRATLKPK
jgi:TPR repeat protein